GIVLRQRWTQSFPAFLDEQAQQTQSIAHAGKTVQLRQCLGQARGEGERFRGVRQGVLSQTGNAVPIGLDRLSGTRGIVGCEVARVDFLAVFVQLIAEDKRKRGSGWVIAGDGLQKLRKIKEQRRHHTPPTDEEEAMKNGNGVPQGNGNSSVFPWE